MTTTIVTSPSQNWDLVPVRGHYMGTDGKPIIGTVRFTPMATRFVDGAAQVTIIGREILASIDPRDGTLLTSLPATDDMDIDGRGFTWEVCENFPGGSCYSISVPVANVSTGIDLATAIQVPPDPGTAANDYVQLVEDSLAEANAAVVASEGHADDAAAAAASVQREQPNGVAGLDGAGKLFSTRIPTSLSKDVANGVAGLDGSAKLPTSSFPASMSRETANGIAGLDSGGKLILSRFPSSMTREANNGVAGLDANGLIYTSRLPAITPDPTTVTKGELVFRITDAPFNAPTNGTSDARLAIQNASAAAAAAGVSGAIGRAVVEFPYVPGGYVVSTPLTLHSGVTYRGDRHVTVKRGGGATQFMFNAGALTDATFEGLTLDSAGILTSASLCVGTGSKVRDCVFIDSGYQYAACYAINFPSGTSLITDVSIENCEFAGLRSNIQVRGNTQRVSILNNDFSDWSNTAIAVDGDGSTCSKDLMIRGNRIHDHRAISRPVTSKKIVSNVATIDLSVAPSWGVGETIYVDLIDPLFDGNHTLTAVTPTSVSWAKTAANTGPTASTGYASSGNRQPISIQSDVLVAPFHERVTITENQIIGNYVNHQATANGGTADMISVHHTNHFVISNNIVEGSGDCGFTISVNSTRGTVTGNTIIGAGNCGIAVGSIAVGIYIRSLTISGNTIMNCGQNGGGIWASTAINLRKLTGGIVVGNFLGDDQAVPTQWYGISLGDTSGGSCTDVHIGPNQYTGVTTAKRWSPSGNVRLTFSDLPTIITKPSDTVQALNSNALVPDPHLQATFETAATYEVEVVLAYTCNGVAGATPGIGVGIYGPTGTTATFYADASGSTATGATTTTSSSNRTFITSINSAINSGGATGASAIRMILKIKVNTGTTSGVFGIRTGQQTADPTNATTVVTGSSMTYRRIG